MWMARASESLLVVDVAPKPDSNRQKYFGPPSPYHQWLLPACFRKCWVEVVGASTVTPAISTVNLEAGRCQIKVQDCLQARGGVTRRHSC